MLNQSERKKSFQFIFIFKKGFVYDFVICFIDTWIEEPTIGITLPVWSVLWSHYCYDLQLLLHDGI